ncbi:VOC family protein [Methyloligella solikamskensis]|uniref:VOC family protein n=1 Tax=Methyloligella solikamskensis TaxID=1177756 RepID=A0ABW3J5U0_9HYPH
MVKHALPAGTPVLQPYLVVSDPDRLINFIRTVFGGTEAMRIHRPDGTIMHAEVRIGNSGVMIGGATEKDPARHTMLHVYVADLEGAFATAYAHGAEQIAPPMDAGDGDRRGGFRDPFGNEWWVATRIETLKTSEIEKRLREKAPSNS